jgi:hypothetical protein
MTVALPRIKSPEILGFFDGGPIPQICYYEHPCTVTTVDVPSLYELLALANGTGGGSSCLHAATSISIQLPFLPACDLSMCRRNWSA